MSEQPLLSYFQLIFSFLFPKITKLLSLIPKISVILALEHISFLLVFYFVRFKLYTRFDVCSYFFAKNLALGENFFLSPTLNIIQPLFLSPTLNIIQPLNIISWVQIPFPTHLYPQASFPLNKDITY